MIGKKQRFEFFVKKLAGKGFLETMQFVKLNENVHYNDIMNFLIGKRIFDARSSVTLMINNLLELDLIERKVLDTKPLRTSYRLSKRGNDALRHLGHIENVLG